MEEMASLSVEEDEPYIKLEIKEEIEEQFETTGEINTP